MEFYETYEQFIPNLTFFSSAADRGYESACRLFIIIKFWARTPKPSAETQLSHDIATTAYENIQGHMLCRLLITQEKTTTNLQLARASVHSRKMLTWFS